MVERYLEFDKQAWWWPGQIHVEAKILEIASRQELNRLDQIGAQYNDNLIATVTAIDTLWNTFLREKYNPTDPRNEELLNQTQAKLTFRQSIVYRQCNNASPTALTSKLNSRSGRAQSNTVFA